MTNVYCIENFILFTIIYYIQILESFLAKCGNFVVCVSLFLKKHLTLEAG